MSEAVTEGPAHRRVISSKQALNRVFQVQWGMLSQTLREGLLHLLRGFQRRNGVVGALPITGSAAVGQTEPWAVVAGKDGERLLGHVQSVQFIQQQAYAMVHLHQAQHVAMLQATGFKPDQGCTNVNAGGANRIDSSRAASSTDATSTIEEFLTVSDFLPTN